MASFNERRADMNTGTQDRRKLIAAAILTSLALFLTMRWLFPTEAAVSAGGALASHAAANSRIQEKAHKNRNRVRGETTDPLLQTVKLSIAENTPYEGTGRNIFADLEETTVAKLQSKAQTDPIRGPGQSSQPTIPTLRLRFFGFATKLTHPQKVFLFQDGDIFIGSEGDVINRRYKIVHVGTTSVEVEDLLESRIHELALAPG